jgi:hypothetical protein
MSWPSECREWWHRLQNAFGTASSAFVAASLQQLIAAARLPNSGISEIAVNASLALIEGLSGPDVEATSEGVTRKTQKKSPTGAEVWRLA